MRAIITGSLLALRESVWLLFCFFIVTALGLSALVSLLPQLRPLLDTNLGGLILNSSVYLIALVVTTIPLWLPRNRSRAAELLGINKLPKLSIVWQPLVMWAFYMVATTAAAILVSIFVPWIDGDQEQNVGFENLRFGYEYVVAFIALVVLPPIAEELLFRGYLYGRLRKSLGFVGTSLVVSVIFGLVHMQWNVAIDTFVLSLFLCYLRERTGSIWASMVLHAIKNGVAYFILFIAPLLGMQLV